MKYNREIHHRRSIRLKGYDYSQEGAYFVTICTWNRECLFGDIVNGTISLNGNGLIVEGCWKELVYYYMNTELGTHIIMPNHMHGIINIVDTANVGAGLKSDSTIVGAGLKPAPTAMHKRHGLPEIVRALKTFSSRKINLVRNTPGVPVWQRNYYEHVVRNEKELRSIQEYIINNPLQWELDENNPVNIK